MVGEGDISDSYVHGDNTCTTCIGVTYYDTTMRAKNEPFMCFGFRGVTDDISPQECRDYEKISKTTYDSYMCIGNLLLFWYSLVDNIIT